MKEKFKGAIVVTNWGKAGLGMSYLTLDYPRIIYEITKKTN